MMNSFRTPLLALLAGLAACSQAPTPTDDQGGDARDDKGDSPTAENAASPLRGIAWNPPVCAPRAP